MERMSFIENIASLHGERLLDLAKDSIAFGIQHGRPSEVDINTQPDELLEPHATFVTLKIANELRGCIGSIQASQPLVKDVAHNAFAAAFSDPRFPPLEKREFGRLSIHIAILSKPEPLTCDSEPDLLRKLHPHIDGLILEESGRRGTFLPAVWESLPEPKLFIEHLKQKTGLTADYWSDSMRFYRYRTHTLQDKSLL